MAVFVNDVWFGFACMFMASMALSVTNVIGQFHIQDFFKSKLSLSLSLFLSKVLITSYRMLFSTLKSKHAKN